MPFLLMMPGQPLQHCQCRFGDARFLDLAHHRPTLISLAIGWRAQLPALGVPRPMAFRGADASGTRHQFTLRDAGRLFVTTSCRH